MLSFPRQPVAVAAAVATLCAAVLLAACGGGNENSESARAAVADIRFDPADFARDTGANKWLPLKPGTQWVRHGATDVGHRRVPHRVVSTVTDAYKKVDGVRAVAVLDQNFDAGEIAQESIDFFAEDRKGNVWDVGSYTEAYEGGRFVSVRDAWLAGVKGGRPGIVMQGDPRTGTPPYWVARPPGEESDVAQVVKTGESRCVPFKCFKGAVVVREGKASAPDNEFKYFAAGVGQIDNVPRSASQHHDVEKLINLTQLSPRGLAEMSTEALKLDRHARVTKPDVYGRGPAARRAP
jgi:hypothetical protein